MEAKKIAEIAEALEKLGYEVTKIIEYEKNVVFPTRIEIGLIPIEELKIKNKSKIKF